MTIHIKIFLEILKHCVKKDFLKLACQKSHDGIFLWGISQ